VACRAKLGAARSEAASLHKQLEAEKRDVDRLRALTMKGDATVRELLDQLQVSPSTHSFSLTSQWLCPENGVKKVML